jgi:hypothetical protein
MREYAARAGVVLSASTTALSPEARFRWRWSRLSPWWWLRVHGAGLGIDATHCARRRLAGATCRSALRLQLRDAAKVITSARC